MSPDSGVSIAQVIAARHSVRSYRPEALPAQMLDAVMAAGADSVALDPSIRLRFALQADGPAFLGRLGGGLASYGRILNAPHYIVAISETRPGYMTNAGFRMEQMILHATSLGLGTCWLGGLYRRRQVGEILGIGADEQVVAITPLGYPAGGAGALVGRTIKLLTPRRGQRRPLAELVYAGRWGAPAEALLAAQPALRAMLEAARLAPSWVNSQPWRFIASENNASENDLVIAVTRPTGQTELPYYLLDGGIAMSHVYLVAREVGRPASWDCRPETLAPLRAQLGIPPRYEALGRLAW